MKEKPPLTDKMRLGNDALSKQAKRGVLPIPKPVKKKKGTRPVRGRV